MLSLQNESMIVGTLMLSHGVLSLSTFQDFFFFVFFLIYFSGLETLGWIPNLIEGESPFDQRNFLTRLFGA